MGRFRISICTAIGCWAFIIMPAMCTAGILTHPCAPHKWQHPVEHSHGVNEDGDHHESNCAHDPCEIVVTRPSDDYDVTVGLHSSVVSATPVILVDPLVLTPLHRSSPPSYLSRASFLDALTSTVLLI